MGWWRILFPIDFLGKLFESLKICNVRSGRWLTTATTLLTVCALYIWPKKAYSTLFSYLKKTYWIKKKIVDRAIHSWSELRRQNQVKHCKNKNTEVNVSSQNFLRSSDVMLLHFRDLITVPDFQQKLSSARRCHLTDSLQHTSSLTFSLALHPGNHVTNYPVPYRKKGCACARQEKTTVQPPARERRVRSGCGQLAMLVNSFPRTRRMEGITCQSSPPTPLACGPGARRRRRACVCLAKRGFLDRPSASRARHLAACAVVASGWVRLVSQNRTRRNPGRCASSTVTTQEPPRLPALTSPQFQPCASKRPAFWMLALLHLSQHHASDFYPLEWWVMARAPIIHFFFRNMWFQKFSCKLFIKFFLSIPCQFFLKKIIP